MQKTDFPHEVGSLLFGLLFFLGILFLVNQAEQADGGLRFTKAEKAFFECSKCTIVDVRSAGIHARWLKESEGFFKITFLGPNSDFPDDPIRYVVFAAADRSIEKMEHAKVDLSLTRLSNMFGQQPKIYNQRSDQEVWSASFDPRTK